MTNVGTRMTGRTWRASISRFMRRIAITADGLAPTLIRWEGAHPVERLPDVGVTVESFELEHPRAAEIQRQLDLLGLPFRCSEAPAPRIAAQLNTPAGRRTLSSAEPIR